MNLSVQKITESELTTLLFDIASVEGWNYSNEDVHFFLNNPDNKLYSVKVKDELAGCILLHESKSHFNNMPLRSGGIFLVTPQYRGSKIVGPYLWENAILNNLDNDMITCFHSVPRVANFYVSYGFKQTGLADKFYTLMVQDFQSHHSSLSTLSPDDNIKILGANDFEQIEKYNSKLFQGDIGIGFHRFINAWINRTDAILLGYFSQNDLIGYGIVTICKRLEDNQYCYRISPLYADNSSIAIVLLENLINIVSSNAHRIELSSLATFDSPFDTAMKAMGFIESGKNYIVCSHPELINQCSPLLQHIFCSLPLEYPSEAIATA